MKIFLLNKKISELCRGSLGGLSGHCGRTDLHSTGGGACRDRADGYSGSGCDCACCSPGTCCCFTCAVGKYDVLVPGQQEFLSFRDGVQLRLGG